MHKPIHVAFVGETSYPSHNIKWINHLVEREGIEGIVLTRANQNADHISTRVKVIKDMIPFPYFNLSKRAAYVRKLKTILEENSIDVVHFLWGVDDCVLGPLLGKPYLITTRGSDVFRDLTGHYLNARFKLNKRSASDFFKSKMLIKAYKEAGAVTSTSKSQIDVLKNFCSTIKRHELVRTGVYLDELKNYSKDVLRSQTKVIFSPRTMRPIYNQDIILKAFAEILKVYPETQLRMIDNVPGSDWSRKIRALAEELNLGDNLVILPSLNKEEMYIEYQKASVCVMIPVTDGVPVTGLESMAIGTPIILGEPQYDQDIFNDQTVWKLHTNDSEELKNELLKIFGLKKDELRIKTTKARDTVLSLGDRNIEMRKVADLYQSMI